MGKPAARLHAAAALGDGLAIELTPDQAHRLRVVLRLGPGDRIALFNGRDGEWLGRIDRLARGTGAVLLEKLLRPQQEASDLWLAFAPVKRAPLDLLVEKATELGVSAFLPVITRHTQVERFNLDRLRAHAREAAEQSERLTLPRIAEPQPLDRLIADWPAGRRLVLCDESGAAPPIAAALAGLGPGPLAVMVGPEGGFAESELDGLRKLSFVCPVGLGPRVLRSDTAALVGLAVVQALAGDWRVPRRRHAGAAADAPT
jgi:16S rRNA (uracil1498-N3)-methyltransferase